MNLESLLAPLPGDLPSGEELRNNPRFHAIERLLESAARAQRVKADGSINESAPPVDWATIEAEGEALAATGRDLRLLVVLVRVLFATDRFQGLSQGVGLLTGNINNYWDSIHPLLRERDDPAMAAMARANALRQLENDDNGLLGDLSTATAFSPRGLGLVTFGDLAAVLRSDHDVLSRAASGLNKTEQDAILARHSDRAKRTALACRAMATEQAGDVATMAAGVAASLRELATLSATYGEKSGTGADGGLALPKLAEFLTSCGKALDKALAEAQPETAPAPAEATSEPAPGAAASANPSAAASPASAPAKAMNGPSGAINSRMDVEASLDRIVAFYERTEPSSPIPHVARRLRRMVAMDFLQLMQEVAPSGLKEFKSVAGIEDSKKPEKSG